MAKVVDTLRNLLNNDPQKLRQHTVVEERSIDSYLLENWKWDAGRYNVQRSVKELVEQLNKVSECASSYTVYRLLLLTSLANLKHERSLRRLIM